MDPIHSGSSSEAVQGSNYLDVGLAFCPLLVAASKGPHASKEIGTEGGPSWGLLRGHTLARLAKLPNTLPRVRSGFCL